MAKKGTALADRCRHGDGRWVDPLVKISLLRKPTASWFPDEVPYHAEGCSSGVRIGSPAADRVSCLAMGGRSRFRTRWPVGEGWTPGRRRNSSRWGVRRRPLMRCPDRRMVPRRDSEPAVLRRRWGVLLVTQGWIAIPDRASGRRLVWNSAGESSIAKARNPEHEPWRCGQGPRY